MKITFKSSPPANQRAMRESLCGSRCLTEKRWVCDADSARAVTH